MTTTPEEFLCIRCSRVQKTCCEVAEIYTTLGDVARITAHTGLTDFVEFRLPEDQAYVDQDDDPPWRDNVFLPDGTRRVLKRRPEGGCMFLGSAGCTLPYETRPLICRLYPFDYSAEGIKQELSTGCPVHLLRPGLGLIAALEMNIVDAERWRKQLYEEIQVREGEPPDADRTDV